MLKKRKEQLICDYNLLLLSREVLISLKKWGKNRTMQNLHIYVISDYVHIQTELQYYQIECPAIMEIF